MELKETFRPYSVLSDFNIRLYLGLSFDLKQTSLDVLVQILRSNIEIRLVIFDSIFYIRSKAAAPNPRHNVDL
jgi:hypothetical protein